LKPESDTLVRPPAPESESAHESLMQFLYQAPVGLVQTQLDGTVDMMNPMAASLLIPLSGNGNLDNLFTVLEEVAPQLRRTIADSPASSGPVCEALRLHVAGGSRDPAIRQTLSLSLLRLDGSRLMAMISDITLEVQREQTGLDQRLRAAARIDVLTQMPNRAAVQELLARAVESSAGSGRQFAVLFLNCDRFKQINDSLGHAAGDEVLGLMAERLRLTLRQQHRGLPDAGQAEPDMAGRIGGDEFAVVVSALRTADDVQRIAQRLLVVLGKPYAVHGRQLHADVSIGIVLQPQMTGDADRILQDASIAMREAKRLGGGRSVVFESSMHDRAQARGAMEMALRRALAQEELFVVYQPVVDLQHDGADPALPPHAAGIEALVRWRHPERGLVPPLDFIGIAEACGLISQVGEFVLRTACRQFMRWQAALGAAAPRLLAVNLSRAQLLEPGFVDIVSRTLASCDMRPEQLQLEVTESLAAQDHAVQAELRALQALGLTLALDDFGTGYSSLSSLHQLPVTTVKIDRSFVSEAVTSAHHRLLIEVTISVARSLGMATVAEGIETREQGALLRRLGCHKGQGYFFSRPLAADDLARWALAPEPAPPWD